jgi:hypothetical protein
MRAVEVRKLTKVYGRAIRAVDGISFDVDEGTVFGWTEPLKADNMLRCQRPARSPTGIIDAHGTFAFQ